MLNLAKVSLVVGSLLALSACSTRSAQELIGMSSNKNYDNMYLRGVFNWWEASEGFKLQAIGNKRYSLTIELIADGQPYDFKVADEHWTPALNCGLGKMKTNAELSKTMSLVCQENSLNIQFIPVETGRFTFVLDTNNVESPNLTITKQK